MSSHWIIRTDGVVNVAVDSKRSGIYPEVCSKVTEFIYPQVKQTIVKLPFSKLMNVKLALRRKKLEEKSVAKNLEHQFQPPSQVISDAPPLVCM